MLEYNVGRGLVRVYTRDMFTITEVSLCVGLNLEAIGLSINTQTRDKRTYSLDWQHVSA